MKSYMTYGGIEFRRSVSDVDGTVTHTYRQYTLVRYGNPGDYRYRMISPVEMTFLNLAKAGNWIRAKEGKLFNQRTQHLAVKEARLIGVEDLVQQSSRKRQSRAIHRTGRR